MKTTESGGRPIEVQGSWCKCYKIPWFINKAIYPTKIKKCFPVGKRFLRSERTPTPLGIFPSDENDEAIQIKSDSFVRPRLLEIDEEGMGRILIPLNDGTVIASFIAIVTRWREKQNGKDGGLDHSW